MRRLVIVIFIVVTGLFAMTTSYCQDMCDADREDAGSIEQSKIAQGTVTSIDAGGDVVTINPFDAMSLDNDSITVEVLPQAEICKGDSVICSSDIEIGDVVDIEYYNDSTGSLKATSINVE